MKFSARTMPALALIVGLALPATVSATNGMFLIGYGPNSRAMGGTAIANPQDALVGAVNPAAIHHVGTRFDVAADLFVPMAKARLGDLEKTSSANRFLIPAFGIIMKFNSKMSFGMSGVGAGGGGSRYNKNLYNNLTGSNVNQTLGINLMIMQMNPTAAYRVSRNHVVGASIVMSVATFRAFGLSYFSNFTSTGLFTKGLTNNGNDWSYGGGVRLGWIGQFLKKRLKLGLTGTSRIYMSRFKKYEDLFAEQGGFDTPPMYGIGAAYKINKRLTVALDITRTLYKDINSIGNTGVCPGPPLGCPVQPADQKGSAFPVSQAVNALGRDEGLGFDWNNQTVYKLGFAYKHNKRWTFRAGWTYGKSPIPSQSGAILFNIVAPAVVQNHATFGLTYKPSKVSEVGFSYVHAFEYKQSGPTFLGSTGEIGMYQNALGISYGLQL